MPGQDSNVDVPDFEKTKIETFVLAGRLAGERDPDYSNPGDDTGL